MSTAIEKVDTGGVIMPPSLRGSGTRVIERDGIRSVAFPPEVFERYNVVTPSRELAALDPMWRPQIVEIQLDAEQHGYPAEKKGDVALAKNGIMALAAGAGIEIRTRRMKRDELRDSEIGWTATARVRQTGGAFTEIEQSKVIDLDHEKELISDQAWSAEQRYAAKDNRPANREKAMETARQRWLKERPHMDAKAETKAALRAIRAAMQLRHALPANQFSRPWLVVKIGFAPDYDDPAIRAQVVAAGLGAASDVYGTPVGELPAADESAPVVGAASSGGEEDPPEDVTDAHVVDEPTAAGDADADYEAWRQEQAEQQAMADPTSDAGETNSWEKILESAGETKLTFGKHNGRTIAEVYAQDAPFLDWLLSSRFQAKGETQQRIRDHARDYLQAARALQIPPGTGGGS